MLLISIEKFLLMEKMQEQEKLKLKKLLNIEKISLDRRIFK
jgi:hypothetical protein